MDKKMIREMIDPGVAGAPEAYYEAESVEEWQRVKKLLEELGIPYNQHKRKEFGLVVFGPKGSPVRVPRDLDMPPED